MKIFKEKVQRHDIYKYTTKYILGIPIDRKLESTVPSQNEIFELLRKGNDVARVEHRRSDEEIMEQAGQILRNKIIEALAADKSEIIKNFRNGVY